MTDLSQAPDQFLTPEESAEVDAAMLTARDRFSTRVAIYALRSLKQISAQNGVAIAALSSEQIRQWIGQDPTLKPEAGFDQGFKGFFSQLVISSLKPLTQMADANGVAIEDLNLTQVITWFEQQAKHRIEQANQLN